MCVSHRIVYKLNMQHEAEHTSIQYIPVPSYLYYLCNIYPNAWSSLPQ